MRQISIAVSLYLLLAFFNATSQELVFNEYYESGQDGWIELVSNSDSLINLSNYKITLPDGRVQFFQDSILSPKSIVIISWGDSSLSPRIDSLGWENQLNKKTFHLQRIESINADSMTVWPMQQNNSFSRIPDITGHWQITPYTSQGVWNVSTRINTEANAEWTLYNAPSVYDFSPRDGAGLVSFRNELWLLGGWKHGTGPSELTSEIWKTHDGITWTFMGVAPWPGRHHFGAVVHQDKIWVMSGDFNADVWSSSDGINWELVTDNPPWGSRYAPYVVTFNNKLWIMGGQTFPMFPDGSYNIGAAYGYNDVWSSTDGLNWTLVTEHAPWPPRAMIMGQVVKDGKMWIMGGGVKGWSTYAEYNDVWNSEDGISWNQVTEHALWDPRIHVTTTTYNNEIWVLSGSPQYPHILTNEAWSSSDGVTWRNRTVGVKWQPSHAISAVEHKGDLWFSTGYNSNSTWKYTEEAFYYLKPGGDLTSLASWDDNPNGDGNSPPFFGGERSKFIIDVADTVVLNSNWAFQSDSTEIIVGRESDSSTVLLISDQGLISGAQLSLNVGATLISQSSTFPKLKHVADNTSVLVNSQSRIHHADGILYNFQIISDSVISFKDSFLSRSRITIDAPAVDAQNTSLMVLGDVHLSMTVDSLGLKFVGENNQEITCDCGRIDVQNFEMFKAPNSTVSIMDSVRVERLHLIQGNIQVLSKSLEFGRLLQTADSYVYLSDTSRIKTKLVNELFLPIGFEASQRPLSLSTKDTVEISIGFESITFDQDSVDSRGYLNRGWSIKTDSVSHISVKAYWRLDMGSQDLNNQNTALLLYGLEELSVQNAAQNPTVSQNGFFSLERDITGNESLVFVADFKSPFIKAYQEVSPIETIVYSPDLYPFSAELSSGLLAEFESLNEQIATVESGKLRLKNTGLLKLLLRQPGNTRYFPMEETVEVEVIKAKQEFFIESSDRYTYSPLPLLFHVKSSAHLPIQIISNDEKTATVVNDRLMIKRAGVLQLRLFQPGTNLYFQKDTVLVIQIDKAPLLVTAEDKQALLSDNVSIFALKYTGFLGDEIEDSLSTKPYAYSLARPGIDVGTFPILIKEGYSDKYELSYNTGTFTVFERPFSLYPIPSYGFVTLSLNIGFDQRSVVKVLNTMGTLVFKADLGPGNGVYPLDLSHLNEGVYVVILESDHQKATQLIQLVK